MDVPLHSAKTLGRALRDARRARGLTQGQTAALAGVAQPTVSKIERGTSQATLDTLLRLLAALQLELVVRGRDSGTPATPWEDGR